MSDSPEQVAQELRIDTGQSSDQEALGDGGERGRFGGRGGIGRGGFGGTGRGQGGSGETHWDQVGSDDRKKLNELTDAVQFASPTLTILQSDNDITIASTRGGTQTLHANGKAEKQQLDAGVVNRTATWEGPQLLVAYEVGHAGTLTYTYSLVPTTKQLLIRVNFERRPGQPGPFDIKLVYGRAVQK